MPVTAPSRPKRTTVKRAASATPMPRQSRPRPKRARVYRRVLPPLVIIVAIVAAHLTALATLNYEHAQLEQLRRETDRVKLNIEKLKGQIAVYKNEVALNRWAEQAGMVRVELQPELTILGLDTPTPPVAPVAMRPAERE